MLWLSGEKQLFLIELTSYWAKLNGNGEIVWGREYPRLSIRIDPQVNPLSADPELTSLGESQAVVAHEAWKSELEFGLPIPGQLYCSPLTRALRTYEITFDGILPDDEHLIVLEVNIHPSSLSLSLITM